MGWFFVGLVWVWASSRVVASERARIAATGAATQPPRTVASIPLNLQAMLPPSQRKVPG